MADERFARLLEAVALDHESLAYDCIIGRNTAHLPDCTFGAGSGEHRSALSDRLREFHDHTGRRGRAISTPPWHAICIIGRTMSAVGVQSTGRPLSAKLRLRADEQAQPEVLHLVDKERPAGVAPSVPRTCVACGRCETQHCLDKGAVLRLYARRRKLPEMEWLRNLESGGPG